ncbi:MAG: prolyl oligopeptidase family serine peptidase [Propionicimonas sp.]|nr:prolyl oligopeptidase family serine peptidase [Propionicimonas sp.]
MSEAPYGAWASPITADDLTAATVSLAGGIVDDGVRYWTQAHPEQAGRVGLWREDARGRVELTPQGYVRTGVNEYGGGDWTVAAGVVVYSAWPEGSLHVIETDGTTRRFAPGGPWRYAALFLDPARRLVLAVREDHTVAAAEPITTIVALDLDSANPEGGRVLVGGADFYAHPVLSPDGRLAWVEWDHPAMPWDATRLKVAPLADLASAVSVGGGDGVAALYPAWSPDGSLVFLADQTGFWNFYRWDGEATGLLYEAPCEFCGPAWTLAPAPYSIIDAGRIGCSPLVHGFGSLAVLHHGPDAPARLELIESDAVSVLVSGHGQRSLALLGYADRPAALVEVDWTTRALTPVRTSSDRVLDPALISRAQPVSWASPDGEVHAWYYPPTNPAFTAPDGELPPVQVWSHGGPTGFSSPEFRIATQFWTSRGIGILDVNYSGSAGFGRAYRERLKGSWGITDVRDCSDGALALVERGLADGDRLSIRGGSAGGYTTLAALTFTDVFAAGISLYGIGDLEALATDTHKFESRYLDSLVAPYPAGREVYLERSPLYHLDGLNCPMLILQGTEDKVVPPDQAEQMVAAVRAKGLPVAYLLFEGEGHGFRAAENISATAQAALAFLGRVHGFTPADDLPALDLR